VLAMGVLATAGAAEWTTRWGLGSGVGYTDNVELAPSGQEQSSLLLGVTPSLQMQGVSGRSNTNLSAQFTTSFPVAGGGSFQISPNVTFSNSTEILKQNLFLNTTASIRRAFSLRDDAVSSTGFSNSGFTTSNLTISPVWQQHFAGYADVVASYTYGTSFFGRDTVSDTDSHSVNLVANSGTRTPRLVWDGFLNYRKSTGGNDNNFNDYSFNFAYNFINDLQFVGQFGSFNSQANQGGVPGANDGTRARVGFAWTPSPRTSLGLLAGPDNWAANASWGFSDRFQFDGEYGRNGRDNFTDLTGGRPFWNVHGVWNPSPRTSVDIAYFRPEFGFNSEQANWRGELSFRRRHGNLVIRGTQQTTTNQLLLQQSSGFVLDPNTGAPVVDASGNLVVTGSPVVSNTNDVFISRCLELEATRDSRKNSFTARGGVERREFDTTANDERIYGGSFLWTYSMNPRTSFNSQLAYLNTLFNNPDTEDQQWLFRVSIGKRLGKNLSVNLQYSLNRRDSTDSDRAFTENAVILNFGFGNQAGSQAFAVGGLGTGGGFVAGSGGGGGGGGGGLEFGCSSGGSGINGQGQNF